MARRTFSAKSTGSAGMLQWLGLAFIILLADQFTKVLILGYYQLGDSTYVTSFFNIVRVHNSGAAFSFLAGASGWQRWFFTVIGVLAAASSSCGCSSRTPGQKLFAFAMACILGGAIGNVIDRLLHGYVVDFLDFHCARLALPGLQRGRQRHHHRRGLPDPGRNAARAARALTGRAGARKCVDPSAEPAGGHRAAGLGHAPGAHRHPARARRQPAPGAGRAVSATDSHAVVSGLGVTALVQSSTATALIVASFVGQA